MTASTAKRQTKVARHGKDPASPLLRLPAELRNQIYEHIAASHATSTVDMCTGGMALHPLSDVSRQLRAEFQKLYTTTASAMASTLRIHVPEFNFALIQAMVAPLQKIQRRALNIVCHITNDFSLEAEEFTKWQNFTYEFWRVKPHIIRLSYTVRYDIETFSVGAARVKFNAMHVMNRSLCRAFEESINRHDSLIDKIEKAAARKARARKKVKKAARDASKRGQAEKVTRKMAFSARVAKKAKKVALS